MSNYPIATLMLEKRATVQPIAVAVHVVINGKTVAIIDPNEVVRLGIRISEMPIEPGNWAAPR